MNKLITSRVLLATISFGALVLTSCSFFPLTFTPFDGEMAPLSINEVTTSNYYRPATYEDDYTELFRSQPNSSSRNVNLRSTGTQKILVIPVDFTDQKCDQLAEGCTSSRIVIQNAFFGNEDKTQWQSVASYFNQSSYGQLILDGTVSDWFHSGESAAALLASGNKTTASERILKAAVNWYKASYEDINSFDQDEDGFIDSVYLVYSAPYENSDSLFWAYTSFDTGLPDLLSPVGNAYVWASYSFLNVYNNKADTHTFIHEMGHLFGLTDYYNTSKIPSTMPQFPLTDPIEKRYQYTNGPTGKVDMMDYSIGDHSVLSKMTLNWTRPYVVTAEGEITISPFVDTGEAIIIAPNWSGSASDEYLALEFYSPTGINYVDATSNYGPTHTHLMSNFGLKVYHVDARASYHRSNGTDTFLGYVKDTSLTDLPSDVQEDGSYYRRMAHTNTYSTSLNNNLVYRLMEKDGNRSFLTGAMATNDTLFYSGDSFGISTFEEFTFHSGDTLPFDFTIVSMSRYETTISFTINESI